MIYTEPANLRFSDFNKNGVLSYEGIFRAFESVSVHHSDSVGQDMFDTTENGMAWIITTWHIKIHRLPRYKEVPELTARTWTYAKKPGATTSRFYQVVDQKGNPLVEGHAIFCLLDIHTQKLVRYTQELIDLYQPEPEEHCLFGETKLRPVRPLPLEEYETSTPLQIRRTDIDYNRHVHNIEYINYAMEALTQEDFDNDILTDLKITYHAQVFETDNVAVLSKYTLSEDGLPSYNIAITANNKPACIMELS